MSQTIASPSIIHSNVILGDMKINCDWRWVSHLQAFDTFYVDLTDAKWTALISKYRDNKTLRTNEKGEFSGSYPISESI